MSGSPSLERTSNVPLGRRAGYSLFLILAATCSAALVLGLFFAGRETNFFEVGLGSDSASMFAATPEGRAVHCQVPWETSPDPCQPPAAAMRKPRALWLGASQLHVIMRNRPDSHTVVDLTGERLRARGADLVTYSVGNANFQELWLIMEEAFSRMPAQALILGAVFDDMKEEMSHPGMEAILDNPAALEVIEANPQGKAIAERLRQQRLCLSSRPAAIGNDQNRQTPAPQEASEKVLTEWLEAHWPLWRSREEARGWLFVSLMKLRYELMVARYTLLGQQPPPSYVSFPLAQWQANQRALEAMIQSASARGMHIILYIAPRPKHVFFPYEPKAYAEWKARLHALTAAVNGTYLNLENIADDDVWGVIHNGQGGQAVDLFHFDAKGHRQLAETLTPAILEGLSR